MSTPDTPQSGPMPFAEPIPLRGRVLMLEWSGMIPPPFVPAGETDLIYSSLDMLGPAQFRSLAPDVILCPLFSAATDAVQIVEHLADLGYTGPVFAIGPDLPRPELVQEEIRAIAPAITFRLVVERE